VREKFSFWLSDRVRLKVVKDSAAQNQRIAQLRISEVYPLYLAKIERKGRTKKELDQVIRWLTGFGVREVQKLIKAEATFEEFFSKVTLNPNATLIKGSICGIRVEEIKDPLSQKVRYLDKLVDELAQGKKMSSILRVAE
jgi:hypothetical protein